MKTLINKSLTEELEPYQKSVAETFRKMYHDPQARGQIATANRNHLRRVLEPLKEKSKSQFAWPPGTFFGSRALRGLEIGCHDGGTTRFLLDNGIATMWVIDTFAGSPEHNAEQREGMQERFYQNLKDYLDRLEKVFTGRSDEGLAVLLTFQAGNQQEGFDLIYVDGSHDSRDVIVDLTLSWRLLKPGGVLVVDDYLWNYHNEEYRNPRPAIDFFLNCHAAELAIMERNWQVSVRKNW